MFNSNFDGVSKIFLLDLKGCVHESVLEFSHSFYDIVMFYVDERVDLD